MKHYFGIAAILLMAACTNTDQKSTAVTDSTTKITQDSTTAVIDFKDPKVSSIYTSYISLKDALVASKFEEAKSAAQSLTPLLKKYAGCENTALIATEIEKAKDIAGQRAAFTHLSTDVIALFKNAELNAGAIYVQHCPMANKGDGGDWLSSKKAIENPYYGDEMMACGAVVEEIKVK